VEEEEEDDDDETVEEDDEIELGTFNKEEVLGK